MWRSPKSLRGTGDFYPQAKVELLKVLNRPWGWIFLKISSTVNLSTFHRTCGIIFERRNCVKSGKSSKKRQVSLFRSAGKVTKRGVRAGPGPNALWGWKLTKNFLSIRHRLRYRAERKRYQTRRARRGRRHLAALFLGETRKGHLSMTQLHLYSLLLYI